MPRSSAVATSAQNSLRTSAVSRWASSPSVAFGIGLEQHCGDDEGENAIAEEFEPLIALAGRGCSARVGERRPEQLGVGELMGYPALQRRLRGVAGLAHRSVKSRSQRTVHVVHKKAPADSNNLIIKCLNHSGRGPRSGTRAQSGPMTSGYAVGPERGTVQRSGVILTQCSEDPPYFESPTGFGRTVFMGNRYTVPFLESMTRSSPSTTGPIASTSGGAKDIFPTSRRLAATIFLREAT